MALADEPICHGCLDEREKYKLPPRKLVRLPDDVTEKEFKHKEIPVYLCEHCDPDELESAILIYVQPK